MQGIDLDKPIIYKSSSLRFFEPNEHHVTRTCTQDVLLLVYDGVLRFSEDGVPYEIHAGQYYIQKHGGYQSGELASSAPKYLYVHFLGEWGDSKGVLPRSGSFEYTELSSYILELDRLSHGECTYTECAALFFSILSKLYRRSPHADTLAESIRRFIDERYLAFYSLDDLCNEMHYSKNYIINVFKEEYGMTPIEYLNEVKIRRAMYLLEVTSHSIDDIARESGFNHYSHFYRLFIRKQGISPFEWRRRIRVAEQPNGE